MEVPAPRPSVQVGMLMRTVPVLRPDDTLRKAVWALRKASCGVVPVVEGGHVVGLLSEVALRSVPGAVTQNPQKVRDIMSQVVTAIPAYTSPQDALMVLQASDADVLPVIDYGGSYRGMVTRSDVLQGLSGIMVPERIGGMATPLGVYLTCGSARGGAGNLGLFLAGAALFGCMLLGTAMVAAVMWYIRPLAAIQIVEAFMGMPGVAPTWTWAVVIVVVGFVFRASPLAAYHAAEHQVVHAIERGEDLAPNRVARMPRVHPRCGTNLVMVGLVATTILTLLGGAFEYIILAVIIGLLLRGITGGLAQHFVTTKTPRRHELESGIRAAEELIWNYQQTMGQPVGMLRRLLATGLLHVALGLMGPMYLLSEIMAWVGFSF